MRFRLVSPCRSLSFQVAFFALVLIPILAMFPTMVCAWPPLVLGEEPASKSPPPPHHVIVCADAGKGGYEAFPDVALTADGSLVCVFYAGFGHVSLSTFAPGGKLPPECPKSGSVALVRSRDLGRTWSKAETVVDTELDDRDPSIVELSPGILLVTYFSLAPGEKAGDYRFVQSSLVKSIDGGKTWSAPRKLWPDWAVSTPARKLSDGRLALAVYYVGGEKSPGGGYGGISFSSDGGETWSPPVPVGKEGPLVLDAEPDVVEVVPGDLLMALRPILAWSRSTDGGKTWSTPVRSGFEGHCPYFLKTRAGALLVAHRLPATSIHISRDGGKTWGENVMVDEVGGAYPSMVELPDGRIIIVYYEEGSGSNLRARFFRLAEGRLEFEGPPGK